MKFKRVLVKGVGVYHVFNRTAYARYILEDIERDMFVSMMRKQAAFCGLEILSYCILSNHFHMLVRVPNDKKISDAELIERYKHLYQDDPAPKAAMRPSDLEAVLKEGSRRADEIRRNLRLRMHRLPVFMKELQQRFGIWYNRTHGNKGTLWSERFRSVLIEHNPRIMQIVAAYIELNSVRAGLADRPELYRWCSLAMALKGDPASKAGIRVITGQETDAERATSIYIRHVNKLGGNPRSPGRSLGNHDATNASAGDQFRHSAHSVLNHRIAAFTRGIVMGTQEFLNSFSSILSQGLNPISHRRPECFQVMDKPRGALCSLRKGR